MALEGGTYRTTRSTRLGIVSLRADSIPVLDKISVKWVFSPQRPIFHQLSVTFGPHLQAQNTAHHDC